MKIALLLSSILSGIALTPAAYAQTVDPEQDTASAPAMDVIIVTARQRAESLQDVPIAVAAVSGDFLEQAQVQNIDGVEKYMPNVELGRHPFTGGGMSASIRGVSFGDLDRAFEPAVAVAVDGIFMASNTGAMNDTFDIEQIEVLRGPQGTLFGRNTIGGVINIKRTKPTMDWGAKVQAAYGSFDRRELKGVFNAPLGETLGLKLGGYLERSDSFTKNSDGKRQDGIDKVSLFGALRFASGSNFDAVLSVDYIDDQSKYPALVPLTSSDQLFCVAFGSCYATEYQTVEDSGFKLALDDYPFSATLKSTAVSLNMSYEMGGITLESITGFMDQKDALNGENTGAAPVAGQSLFVSKRNQKANQFSQELRAISNLDGSFNFVAGLYYMRSEFDLMRQTAEVLGATAQDFSAGQNLDAYAAYAEGFVDLTDSLRLTVGGRYTIETKDFYIAFRNPATGAITGECPDTTLADVPGFESCRDPSVTFKKFTPRVILDYHITPDVMLYGSWSRGYRSGGWNSRASVVTAIGPYEPEEVDSFEGGLRTTLLDGAMRFNLTGFYTDYSNKQEEVITSSPVNPTVTQTTVENAGAATIKGFEGELEYRPIDWLRLRSAVGYLDGKYDEFIQGGVDLSDQRNLRYAPKWSVSVGGDASYPLGDDKLLVAANYKWTDRFATSVVKDLTGLDRDFIEAYGTFDFSMGYEGNIGSQSKWHLSAFINDAFHSDGRLYRKVIVAPFAFASREAGRTLGIELGFEY